MQIVVQQSEEPAMTLRTRHEAKAELLRLGISATEWARANGLRPLVVSQVLRGNVKCTRGEAHKAAVLLGMKDGEILSEHRMKDALALPKSGSNTRRFSK